MDDELFQSLGGSLMKDLLADLQGDDGEGDGWLSLEQLEKELSQLDSGTGTGGVGVGGAASMDPPFPTSLPVVPSAASMVVTGQQQQQQQQPIQGVGLLGQVTVTKQAPADAWKESLQKFTALSLDQDFLAADTVRKQQQQHKPTVTPSLPPGFLAEAQDYDATEKVTLKPPPGLMGASAGATSASSTSTSAPPKPPPGMQPPAPKKQTESSSTISQKEHDNLAASLASALLPGAIPPSIPEGKPLPKTPANSIVLEGAGIKKMPPKTPRNSVIIASEAQAATVAAIQEQDDDEGDDDIPMMGKVSILKKQPEGGEKPKEILPTKTPRNSVAVPSADAAAAAAVVAASAAAQGMAMPPPQMQGRMPPGAMPQGGMPPPQGMPGMPPPHMMHPQMMQQPPHKGMPPGMMPPPPQGMPQPGMPPPQGMPPPMQGMPPQGMPPGAMPPPQGMPPPHMMAPGAVPVAMRMQGGPAWQQRPQPPPPPPPQPPMRVFCNPHPNAPPIPAQALESSMMKSRDISYIIHSILKPILMAGFSEYDYDIQLLYRQSGARPAGPRPVMFRGGQQRKADSNSESTTPDAAMQQEMASREKKSKEWSTKNAALGHIPKANVSRPRALIASPVMASQQDNDADSNAKSEQKQRARLWKARIYCDQAYQAYLAVVDIWAKAAPGSVPPQVQAPLIKLMKCLGIAPETESTDAATATSGGGDFKVDPLVLQLFLKLSKGRVLMARIVEQALLPPSAVQAVLPSALDILYKTPPPQPPQPEGGDRTDDRCFRALTVVIQTLPSLSADAVLQCAEVMKANSQAALSSTCRMECLHALLQRGTSMAARPEAAGDFAGQWKETESSFMAILSGM